MRKNPHGKIFRKKPKKQHINNIPKSCLLENIGL